VSGEGKLAANPWVRPLVLPAFAFGGKLARRKKKTYCGEYMKRKVNRFRLIAEGGG
jgi:hypothetical protein